LREFTSKINLTSLWI